MLSLAPRRGSCRRRHRPGHLGAARTDRGHEAERTPTRPVHRGRQTRPRRSLGKPRRRPDRPHLQSHRQADRNLDFESSCDCGEISPRRLTVPAHGSAEVQVKMDLTRRTPQQLGMVRRKFEFNLHPVRGENGKRERLAIGCIAKSLLTADHHSIHFGDLNSLGKPAISRIIVTVHRVNA